MHVSSVGNTGQSGEDKSHAEMPSLLSKHMNKHVLQIFIVSFNVPVKPLSQGHPFQLRLGFFLCLSPTSVAKIPRWLQRKGGEATSSSAGREREEGLGWWLKRKEEEEVIVTNQECWLQDRKIGIKVWKSALFPAQSYAWLLRINFRWIQWALVLLSCEFDCSCNQCSLIFSCREAQHKAFRMAESRLFSCFYLDLHLWVSWGRSVVAAWAYTGGREQMSQYPKRPPAATTTPAPLCRNLCWIGLWFWSWRLQANLGSKYSEYTVYLSPQYQCK